MSSLLDAVLPKTPESLIGGFLESVRRNGDAPALIVDHQSLSYQKLYDDARSLAATILAARPNRAEGQCAIYTGRSRTGFVGILGAQLAGMAFVPMQSDFRVEKNTDILDLSHADILVMDRQALTNARHVLSECLRSLTVILPDNDTLPGWASHMTKHRFILAADLLSADDAPDFLASRTDPVEPGQLAFVLFSSEKNGFSDGIIATQESCARYITRILKRYAPTPFDRFSQIFDLTFSISIHEMFVCWSAGACLCVVPDADSKMPDKFIEDYELTVWFSSPQTAAGLFHTGRLTPGRFPSLHFSLFCHGPLPVSLATAWAEAAPASVIENLYGPTEVSLVSTVYQFNPEESSLLEENIVPIGVPLPGQEAILLGSNGQPVPHGTLGELYIGGEFHISGRKMTSGRFIQATFPGKDADLWYRTGDLALFREGEGFIHEGHVYL